MIKKVIIYSALFITLFSILLIVFYLKDKPDKPEQLIYGIGIILCLHFISMFLVKKQPAVSILLDFLLILAVFPMMIIPNISATILSQKVAHLLVPLSYGIAMLRFPSIIDRAKQMESINKSA